MYQTLIETITSNDDAIRNRTEAELLSGHSKEEYLRMAEGLEFFRQQADNLYHRVRACLFIHAIYRYHLIDRNDVKKVGEIPYDGIRHMLQREYTIAIEIFRASMMSQGCSEALLSALAEAYYNLAFKYLLDQVRQSVRTTPANAWMFAKKSVRSYPLRVPDVYLKKDAATNLYPVGRDVSPVRADPCHAGWSDIFFLGMDFPEGARVVNMSVDLTVDTDENAEPIPPVECYCRVIDEPVIRLVSIDLECQKDVSTIEELFNFGNDHLSLLKAGVIASGAIPPCYEDTDVHLPTVLKKLLGKKGGIEVATYVRDIPKGSRLAVSTTLLAAIITRVMRFTGQIKRQEGGLSEEERRIVASRAILGEWLGGSGGGWQDSGGIWPGIKVIEGVEATRHDPEYGVSHGRLLPSHSVLAREQLPPDIDETLRNSIVMVHGGLSMNVGPILEMVTIRYLLRYTDEWKARLHGYEFFEDIVNAIKTGNMKELGALCTRDWEEATKVIIPWTTSAFTEDVIDQVKEEFGDNYWGFLMLGGASGGGMAFIVDPKINQEFRTRVQEIMQQMKQRYARALPFAMDPVVYDFTLNYSGIQSDILTAQDARMPMSYYAPFLVRASHNEKSAKKLLNNLSELAFISEESSIKEATAHEKAKALLSVITPSTTGKSDAQKTTRDEDALSSTIKEKNGFDPIAHERNKKDLKSGKIGVGNNRMPPETEIHDVRTHDVKVVTNDLSNSRIARNRKIGQQRLYENAVAVVTYAGGLGSRWSDGAAVVKPINPFVEMKGRHRSFIEVHIGKTQKVMSKYTQQVQHVFTTSFLTHEPIEKEFERTNSFGSDAKLYLSRGQSIGHRVYPMERDLRFLWEELSQQALDEQAQKVQTDAREALIAWARAGGEGEDYTDNTAVQRFNPPGHFYEIPNMLRNGTLGAMLKDNPALKHLMVHNADTLGVFLSPIMIGMHEETGNAINYEVTPRRYEDTGGGLARVNGRVQLVEALALPKEEDEYKLSYYNTLTNWINIDIFLAALGVTREDVIAAQIDEKKRVLIDEALHAVEADLPTYVTIKNVKYVWGAGQEDTFPVAQFEKLWGDLTLLDTFSCGFFAVERRRGQQLKDPAQIDRWVRDGSRDYVASKALFARTK